MTRILIPLTNHPTMGDTNEPNGTYAPELTHALHEFLEAGFEYDLISIKGGEAPFYGDDQDDPVNAEITADPQFRERLNNTIKASEVDHSAYDAVYYPGGFGILSDLADDTTVARMTATMFEAGKPVGAVCHGPAGLLPVKLSTGKGLLEGRSATCFTREEEVDYGSIDKIPYLLEERVARTVGLYSKKGPWAEYVVEDDHLITGQNPASAGAVARALIRQLQA